METKTKKKFDAVKFAREQKDRLDKIFSTMTKEEILDYNLCCIANLIAVKGLLLNLLNS
jgi:hypothetical protein